MRRRRAPLLYRTGLALCGIVMLACAVAGIYLLIHGGGIIDQVMRSFCILIFTPVGSVMTYVAVFGRTRTVAAMLRDFTQDIFSRRNLTEFATFWVLVFVIVGAMLVWHNRT